MNSFLNRTGKVQLKVIQIILKQKNFNAIFGSELLNIIECDNFTKLISDEIPSEPDKLRLRYFLLFFVVHVLSVFLIKSFVIVCLRYIIELLYLLSPQLRKNNFPFSIADPRISTNSICGSKNVIE